MSSVASSVTSELQADRLASSASPAKPIFLDNHSTTPVDPRVAYVVSRYMVEDFGNPSSVEHVFGDRANEAISGAREEVARLVGVSPQCVVFVSGATEGANLILSGLASRRRPRKLRLAVPPTEHRAVLDTCRHLVETEAADIAWLRVDRFGRVELNHLEEVVAHGVDVVCAMWANNEIGTIAPMGDIAAIAADAGAVVFSDVTQAAGKLPISAEDAGVHFLTLSAHKMYGPKGIGAAIIPRNAAIDPILFGGGQERRLRPGTLNVPGIVGFGEACRLRRHEMRDDESRIASERDSMEADLQREFSDIIVNGDRSRRLAGNLHISVPHLPNSALVTRLRDRIALSTGAACSSGAIGPSHVLRAIRLPDELMEGAIRIGIGKFNTAAEVAAATELLAEGIKAVQGRTSL